MTEAVPGPQDVRAVLTRRRWLAAGVGTVSLAAGAGLYWWQGRAGSPDAEALTSMWSLRFQTPQGTELTMASLKGKPLLVNFWATWCPPCVEEMPLLDRFFRQQAAKGWQVLGLAVDQPSAVRKFLQATPVAFPIGLAGLEGTDLTRRLGNLTGALPFTVVFGPDGGVRQRRMGRVTEADLQAWSGAT